MSAPPLISVIIPTHNRGAQLRAAVDSVFAQTYDRWELFVVDDGSTDDTGSYLRALSDTRVHALLHDRSGNPALLRNVGAASARGAYLAFLDSDDVWLPAKLAAQVEELAAHPECGWSYTGYVHMDEQGRGSEWRNDRPWVPYGGSILARVITVDAMVAMSTVVVARRVFDAIGGFDEAVRSGEDYDLAIRLAEASPAAVVPAALAKKRQHFEPRPVGQLDVLRYIDGTYRRLLARTTTPAMRRLCRRQRRRFALGFVDRFRGAGQYREARQALWMSFGHASVHPSWWAAFLKTMIRPLWPR